MTTFNLKLDAPEAERLRRNLLRVLGAARNDHRTPDASDIEECFYLVFGVHAPKDLV